MNILKYVLLILVLMNFVHCDDTKDKNSSTVHSSASNNTYINWELNDLQGKWSSECISHDETLFKKIEYSMENQKEIKTILIFDDAQCIRGNHIAKLITECTLSLHEYDESLHVKNVTCDISSFKGYTQEASLLNSKKFFGIDTWTAGENVLFNRETDIGAVSQGDQIKDIIQLSSQKELKRSKNHTSQIAYDKRNNTTINKLSDIVFKPMEKPSHLYPLKEIHDFDSNPGNLRMLVHLPDTLKPGAPLVIVMHGNNQFADELRFAGWNNLANDQGFAVLYPEQKWENVTNDGIGINFEVDSAGLGFGYWKAESDQDRGAGEPLSIKQMVDYMVARYNTDPERVFATGLSGGGAMTAVMMSTYPDVIKGAAIVAGMPYKCATNAEELLGYPTGCGDISLPYNPPTMNKSAEVWGNLVLNAFPDYSGTYPKVSIWHGEYDMIVHSDMVNQLVKQWTYVHNIDMIADETSNPTATSEYNAYKNASGETLVETYVISHEQPVTENLPTLEGMTSFTPGFGHFIAVDPSSNLISGGCGVASGFCRDVGICSTYRIAEFWGIIEK